MHSFNLNKTQIQFAAIIFMTLDHIAWIFAPGYSYAWWAVAFHIAGRITAPVMWFFVAEGYDKTENIGKYALRLFIFSVISHFAFNFFQGTSFNPFAHATFTGLTSVIWGLLGGLAVIYVYDSKKIKVVLKVLLILLICIFTVGADWSALSPAAILWIHINKGKFARQALGIFILALGFGVYTFVFTDMLYGAIQLGICLSLPLMYFYNGKKGKKIFGKYFFYIYYPGHLALLAALRLLL